VKSIAAKMSQVGKSVGFGVPKDGHNASQGYNYTSAASVRMAVGPELARRGLAVSSHVDIIHREAFVNAKGNRQHHVMIRTTLSFYDSESGESMDVCGLGEGVDSGDKACAKAQTMAEKYAYVSAFTLAMGEDPEADESTDRDSLPISASVKRYAYGEEEQARADAQGARTGSAIDGLVADFAELGSTEDAILWLGSTMPQILTLPAKSQTELGKRLMQAAQSIGLQADDFRSAWKAEVSKAKGRK
jgi:hypothetical protein